MQNIYIPGINHHHYYINPRDLEAKEEVPEVDEDESDTMEDTEQSDITIPQHIFTTESIEELVLNRSKAIIVDIKRIISKKNVKLKMAKTLKAMFDSGASINCIDHRHARRYYRKYIKTIRGFYVRTASKNIILNQYVDIDLMLENGETITAKFFLLKNAPHNYIISRSLFLKMGGKIILPNGKEFNNKSTQEDVSPDLYEDLIKHIEYPMEQKMNKEQKKGFKATIQYLQKHRSYSNTKLPPTIRPKQQLEEMVMISLDEQNMELKTDIGEIKDTTIKHKVVQLLREYRSNYAKTATDVGTIPDLEFKIDLTSDKPISKDPYPLSYDLSDEVSKQCKKLEDAGFIQSAESPYAFPVLMVKKPTRNNIPEWRMCIDYRELNAITIKDKYKVPAIRDLYRKLGGNGVFSSFDLKSAYHHIPIAEKDQAKTAFITDKGQTYVWKRLCFGFTNAPACFQRAMDKIFEDLDFVVVYLDDIIVCSKTEKEHIKHLEIVLQRIRKFNLKLRLQKCKFFQKELKYLGMIVTKDGVRADQDYVSQILKFRRPTNVKEIERFIGMVTWLSKFIPNLSKLTSKINELRKKDAEFIWTLDHDRYFEAILAAVQNAKVLRHPDLSKPFYVQTDASDHAIGAVLLQDHGNGYLEPIEFISRKFTSPEQNWHTSEKELVAIAWALQKWVRCLLPNHFTVFTDHKNLENLFRYKGKKLGKLQRWIIYLQQFDFTAKYLPGKDNYIADFLSRDIENKQDLQLIMDEAKETMNEMLTIKISEEQYVNTSSYNTTYIRTPTETPNSANDLSIIPKPIELCLLPMQLRKRERKYYGPKIWDLDTYGVTDINKLREKVDLKQLPETKEEESTHQYIQQTSETIDTSKLNEENMLKEQLADEQIAKLRSTIEQIESGDLAKDINAKIIKAIRAKEYIIATNKIIYKRNKDLQYVPVVPRSLVPTVVSYFHEGNYFQHQGIIRTAENIRQRYYWTNMREDIEKHIAGCHPCNLSNAKRAKGEGQIMPQLRSKAFDQIAIDIVGPLPITSSENRYLITIMDRFTRYATAIPVKIITAETVAQAILDNWIYIYGIPSYILTDNGTQFQSRTLQLIEKILNIQHQFTTIYHPECNGMIERFHRFLKQRLAIKAVGNKLNYWEGDDWDIFIPSILFAYNQSVHTITKRAPFELLYGQKPQLPIDLKQLSEVEAGETSSYEEWLKTFIHQLEIIRNKSFMKQYENYRKLTKKLNKGRTTFKYQIGDLVSRRIFAIGSKDKLKVRYEGPYEIIKIYDNQVTFELQNIMDRSQVKIHGKWIAPYKKGHDHLKDKIKKLEKEPTQISINDQQKPENSDPDPESSTEADLAHLAYLIENIKFI